MFIEIEGIDASGKATQAKLLADALDAELFSFPDYHTPIGNLILQHLKQTWRLARGGSEYDASVFSGHPVNEKQADALMFQCMQFANRLELQPAIQEALDEGKDIVCDRYIGSALAYGTAEGLCGQYLLKVQQALIQPDLSILVDVDVKDSIKRRPERADRYEANYALLEKVRNRYLDIWDELNKQTENIQKNTLWIVIDGRKDIEQVHEEIMSAVRRVREIRIFDSRPERLVKIAGEMVVRWEALLPPEVASDYEVGDLDPAVEAALVAIPDCTNVYLWGKDGKPATVYCEVCESEVTIDEDERDSAEEPQ